MYKPRLSGLLIWIFCCLWSVSSRAVSAAAPQTVHFKTSDDWNLEASYRPPGKNKPVVILIHGVASGKGEWDPLAGELARMGIGSLAIDLRGHGGSLQGPHGRTDYQGFDWTGEWLRMEQDIQAAISFLGRRKIPPSRIALAGASIGANLASRVFTARPALAWAVLLSPGMDYRGVAPPSDFSGRKVLIAASPSDAYAYQSSAFLVRQQPGIRFLEAQSGHGVQMFQDRAFFKNLTDWIRKASH